MNTGEKLIHSWINWDNCNVTDLDLVKTDVHGIISLSVIIPVDSLWEQILEDIAFEYYNVFWNDWLIVEKLKRNKDEEWDLYINPKKWDRINVSNTRKVLNNLELNWVAYTDREIEEIITKIYYYLLTESQGINYEFHQWEHPEWIKFMLSEVLIYAEKYNDELLKEAINRFKRDFLNNTWTTLN